MLSQKFYVWLRIIDRKLDWPQLNISFAFSSFSVCFKSLLSTEYCSAELFKNKVHTGFAHVIINYSKELTEAQLKLRLMFWLSYTVRYFNLWFATLFNKVKTQSLLQWHFKFWSITTISYLTMERLWNAPFGKNYFIAAWSNCKPMGVDNSEWTMSL